MCLTRSLLGSEMKQKPDELSLLDQHIFKQNQHIIEMSARLDGFLSKGNSAIEFAEKKASERNNAIQWAIGGVLVCAVIFVPTGYLLRMSSDAVNLSTAKEKVSRANERADAAESKLAVVSAEAAKATEAAADNLKKQYLAEIEKIRAASGWAGTQQGKLAKKFFESSSGIAAATCNSETWEIVTDKEGKWCIPKRRDLIGGDENKYGWKIP